MNTDRSNQLPKPARGCGQVNAIVMSFLMCFIHAVLFGALLFGAINDILNNDGAKTDWSVLALMAQMFLGFCLFWILNQKKRHQHNQEK